MLLSGSNEHIASFSRKGRGAIMLKKQYLKSRPVCKVTFSLPASTGAASAALVGDFNAWDAAATPMQVLKDGRFKVSLELDAEQQYEFRYLLDESEWINETEADGYAANPFFSENSVLSL
jgi:1,4-alpha-glucan branching enzyme